MLRANAAGGGLDPDLVQSFCTLMEEGTKDTSKPVPARRLVAAGN
jgi:hypothetical protein